VENLVVMSKKNILIFLFMISMHSKAEMINLECKTQTQNSERTNTFSLLLGTETKKAIQILKKGQLTMDLSIQEDYFEVGQFTDASQTDLIVVLRINKATLEIEYAKYMELVEPILCIKL